MKVDDIRIPESSEVARGNATETLAAQLEGTGASETVDDGEHPPASEQHDQEYENAYKHATTKLKRANPTTTELAKLFEGVGGQAESGLESLSLEQLDNLCILCDELTDERKASTAE